MEHTWEETLKIYLDWLTKIGLTPPPTKGIKIFELSRTLEQSDAVDAAAYAARFQEITHARHSWINMECFGIHNDYLIIAVRFPNPEFENLLRPGDPTAVNFGGPSVEILQNNWQLVSKSFLDYLGC